MSNPLRSIGANIAAESQLADGKPATVKSARRKFMSLVLLEHRSLLVLWSLLHSMDALMPFLKSSFFYASDISLLEFDISFIIVMLQLYVGR